MKPKLLTALIILAAFTSCDTFHRNRSTDIAPLSGPYLGMKPPGDVPELFAPGIVSDRYRQHSGAVFTPDGNELFWTSAINEGRTPRIVVILHMVRENGTWSGPELAPFNISTYNHINSVSPDGKRLYFYSWIDEESPHAWMVDKTTGGWSKPLPARINTVDNPGTSINEIHETRNGNIYCFGPLGTMPRGRGIIRSQFNDGKYQDYESAGDHINLVFDDPYPNHSPTVDPDERFVIFVSRRPGGYGFQDLYISYRQPDGSFGPAVNLGKDINSVGYGNSWPQLSPDGKYLFFTSNVRPVSEQEILDKKYSYAELKEIQDSIINGWENIYWVSTGFIEKLNQKENRP